MEKQIAAEYDLFARRILRYAYTVSVDSAFSVKIEDFYREFKNQSVYRSFL